MSYIIKETVISGTINALFSVGFFVGAFYGVSELTLGSFSELTMDFLPQSFFVGLFAALPASLLTLKRLKAGSIAPLTGSTLPLPKSLPLRILCFAFGSLVLFGGAAVLTLALIEPVLVTFSVALIVKIIFALLITLTITPLAIKSVMFNVAASQN